MLKIVFVFVFLLSLNSYSLAARIDAISCDFDDYADNGFCNYTAAPGRFARDDWALVPSSIVRETSKIDGPRTGVSDHGNFIQIIRNGDFYGLRNYYTHGLVSPTIRLSGPHCFSFDYYLFGPAQELTIRANKVDQRSWPKVYLFARTDASSMVDRWNHYQKTVDFEDWQYEIIINSKSKLYNGTVAFDNLLFTEGRCPETNSEVKTCDFDAVHGTADTIGCDWIDVGDPASWKVVLLVQAYKDYSTATDHGGFLKSNVVGTSHSELKFGRYLPQGGRQCLSFRMLTMPGSEWNLTEVYDNGFETAIMESAIDDVGSLRHWTAKYVEIDPIFAMNLSLKVKSGSNVFLDSLELRNGSCPRPLDCTFEDGPCGYMITEYTGLKVGKGRSEYPELVNPLGASIQNLEYEKNFLYYDGTRQHRGEYHFKYLTSSLIRRGGTFCYKFKAKLANGYSDEMQIHNTLQVRVKTRPFSEDTPLLETNYLRRGEDPWLDVFTTVTSKGPFVIQINIDRVNDTTKLQIRDASLEEGSCADFRAGISPVAKYPPLNFHCFSTGHYIPQYRTCDGVIDCPMGEDEGDDCDGHSCSEEGFICKSKGYHFCLTDASRYCNGIQDCDHGVDEDPRFCDSQSFCDNFCLNEGVCVTDDNKRGCDCGEASGKRCHLANN